MIQIEIVTEMKSPKLTKVVVFIAVTKVTAINTTTYFQFVTNYPYYLLHNYKKMKTKY